jgi:hypothetical protein
MSVAACAYPGVDILRVAAAIVRAAFLVGLSRQACPHCQDKASKCKFLEAIHGCLLFVIAILSATNVQRKNECSKRISKKYSFVDMEKGGLHPTCQMKQRSQVQSRNVMKKNYLA